MKKFLIYLLIVTVFSAFLCFYFDQFMMAYGILFVILKIIMSIAGAVSIDNTIYLDKKMNGFEEDARSKYWH